METITITDTQQVTRYEYKAIDGTVFQNQSECEIYEEGAVCAINKAYQSLVCKTFTEFDLCREDNEIEVQLVTIANIESMKILLQRVYSVNGVKCDTKTFESACQEAIESSNHNILVACNSEKDWLWCLGSASSFIQNVVNLLTP